MLRFIISPSLALCCHKAKQWLVNVLAINYHKTLCLLLVGLMELIETGVQRDCFQTCLKHEQKEKKCPRRKRSWKGKGLRVGMERERGVCLAGHWFISPSWHIDRLAVGLGVKAWGLTDCPVVINLEVGRNFPVLLSVHLTHQSTQVSTSRHSVPLCFCTMLL